MLKTLCLLLIVSLLAAACNLSSGSENENAPQATDDLAFVTATPAPDIALIQTTTPSASTQTSASVGGQTSANCAVRADWPIYTVVSGDTLSLIALRASSTVEQLMQANCLDNADVISVGQLLHVPLQPEQPTTTYRPPLSQNPPQRIGGVTVSSSLSGDADFLQLIRDETITLRWGEVPAGAARVVFYIFPSGWTLDYAGPGSLTLGQDNNLADGASIQWTVTGALNGELLAMAYRSDGSLLALTEYNLVVSSATYQRQGCTIIPNTTMSYYEEPDSTSPVVGQVSPQNTLFPLGRSLNGWWAISVDSTQSGSGGIVALRWLPVDADVSTQGGC